MERNLSDSDIQSIGISGSFINRRSYKDRRLGINSVIDPSMDRRKTCMDRRQ